MVMDAFPDTEGRPRPDLVAESPLDTGRGRPLVAILASFNRWS